MHYGLSELAKSGFGCFRMRTVMTGEQKIRVHIDTGTYARVVHLSRAELGALAAQLVARMDPQSKKAREDDEG